MQANEIELIEINDKYLDEDIVKRYWILVK